MSRNLSVLPYAALICLLGALAVRPARGDEAKAPVVVQKLPSLTFGLTGYAGADEARSDSQALQTYLTAKLGRDVTTRIFTTPAALASALAAGQVDLAWIQPFSFVEAQAQAAGVTPLVKAVRHGLPFYRGVLFTQASRAVSGLDGLKGLTVAWVDKNSAAGYLFPRALLVSAGLKPKDVFKSEAFAGDHGAVCKQVLDGTVDVGATYADDRSGQPMNIDGCVQSLGTEATKGLKIIKETQPIPNDAIAARPGIDAGEIARIKKVFLALSKDLKGKSLLIGVFKAEGFDTVDADDFIPVKFAYQAQAATP
jgi:phosphate/phosphite/phosphonate ABC transporter binding protein